VSSSPSRSRTIPGGWELIRNDASIGTSSAGLPDPHPTWASEAAALRAQLAKAETSGLSDDEWEPIYDALHVLEELIASTPAATLVGIAIQVHMALACEKDGAMSMLGDVERMALRQAIASLDRLAGRSSA
jgi:hypothetical protein